jgi:hypothetical protein
MALTMINEEPTIGEKSMVNERSTIDEKSMPGMRRHCTTIKVTTAAVLASLGVLASLSGHAAAPADERPPAFKASALLTPPQARGPHHAVADAVPTPDFYHEFTITSDFGTFEAPGRTMLAVRLHEVDALAQLQDVSKTEVFLKAAGTSVVNIGKGAAAVVTNPEDTAKGLGSGIKRFGINLGRQTQRAVDSSKDPAAGADGNSDTAATAAAKGALGVNGAARRWAQKLGVDPYTTNPVLHKALEDIGTADAAGSIATKVVLPIPKVVGMTATVGGLVWSKDPEELRKINEQRLKELGVADAAAKRLFRNSAMSLTFETRLIAALGAVKVPGCADYVATAADAKNEREALFFVESAELLQQRHAGTPFTAVLTDSRALVAVTADRRAMALLPLDWVRWTGAVESALRDIIGRARAELRAGTVVIALTGRPSPAMARQAAARGWTITTS